MSGTTSKTETTITSAVESDNAGTSPFVSDSLYEQLLAAATKSAFKGSGWGSFNATWQTVMTRYDRFGINPIPPNHEVAGLTFITRPKLNLSGTSLKQDRILGMFNTVDPDSFMFAIRAMLDTKWSRSPNIAGLARVSPFMASDSPFIIPLTNSLMSISGFPDFILDTETTSGGFYGEDQAFVRGSEMNMKAIDIELTFRDIQGGIIAAIFILWTRYMALVARGNVVAYPEDIVDRRINYSCSIYRFVLDPSMRFITKWAKCTGCFPQSFPIGNFFNIGEREHYLHASEQFSIPFKVNNFEAMDPMILREFNKVTLAFCPDLLSTSTTNAGVLERIPAPPSAENNFQGIPYINTGISGCNELMWLCNPDELEDPTAALIKQITAAVSVPPDIKTGSLNSSVLNASIATPATNTSTT